MSEIYMDTLGIKGESKRSDFDSFFRMLFGVIFSLILLFAFLELGDVEELEKFAVSLVVALQAEWPSLTPFATIVSSNVLLRWCWIKKKKGRSRALNSIFLGFFSLIAVSTVDRFVTASFEVVVVAIFVSAALIVFFTFRDIRFVD